MIYYNYRNGRIFYMKEKKLLNSFKYAFTGIKSAFQSERNMKIHITAMILIIILGTILKISVSEWIICLFCFAIVISGELFNTAIEITVDLAMAKKNEQAKRAKDIAAGGVFVCAIFSSLIGILIFLPKIIELF